MLNNSNTNHREEETCHQDHQSTRGNSWMQYPVKNPCLVGKPANRQEGHGQCRKNSAQTMFMKARGALDCDDHRRSIGQGVQPRVRSSVILIQISWTQHQRRPLAVGSNYQRDLIRLTGRQQMESLCGWLLFKAKAHLCHPRELDWGIRSHASRPWTNIKKSNTLPRRGSQVSIVYMVWIPYLDMYVESNPNPDYISIWCKKKISVFQDLVHKFCLYYN